MIKTDETPQTHDLLLLKNKQGGPQITNTKEKKNSNIKGTGSMFWK